MMLTAVDNVKPILSKLLVRRPQAHHLSFSHYLALREAQGGG